LEVFVAVREKGFWLQIYGKRGFVFKLSRKAGEKVWQEEQFKNAKKIRGRGLFA
jgi:hypothetical protein